MQRRHGPRREVCQFCPVDAAGKSLLKAAMQQLGMSARAYHRILKLARTIADPSASSGQAWRAAKRSRPLTWQRRSSTVPAGKPDEHGVGGE